jgi:hypothetical protein
MAKRIRNTGRKQRLIPPNAVAKALGAIPVPPVPRDLFVVQVKAYVTSAVADMLRERRGDVPEAAYMRRLIYQHLGLDHDGKPHAT